jgi:type IV pilus assembly protein PilP
MILISCGSENKSPVIKKKKHKPRPVTVKIDTAALEKQDEELKKLFEKKYVPLQYEHKKNPFKSVIDVYKETLKSDNSQNPLESASLDQVKLVGVMKSEFGYIGVAEVLDQTYYIKVGDKIGRNKGVVIEITNELVKIRQTEKDIFGNIRSQIVELMLENKEGSL